MLPYVQALLFLAGAAFCYFLGATFENFLMEVVRHFVPISPENVCRYNAVNLVASLLPLLGIGLLLHLAIGSEEQKRSRMWKILAGVAVAVLSYRIHHVGVVLWSSALEGSSPWKTRISNPWLFWLHFGGFLLLGVSALVPAYFFKNDMKTNIKDTTSTITLSLIWLWINPMHLNHSDLSTLIFGYGTALGAASILLFLSRKIEVL